MKRAEEGPVENEKPEITPQQEAFLEAFSRYGTLLAAAKSTGINRRTHYRWLEEDVNGVYSEQFQQAQARWGDRIHRAYVHRALHGVKQPVMYRGRVVGEITRYSDAQLARLAKRYPPAQWRRKQEDDDQPAVVVVRYYGRTDGSSEPVDADSDAAPVQDSWSTKMKKKAFLEAIRQGETVAGAARSSRIDRSTHYEWLLNDENYKQDFEDAAEELADRIDMEVRHRVFVGVPKPIYWRGKVVGEIMKKSEMLLVLLLKRTFPEFADHHAVPQIQIQVIRFKTNGTATDEPGGTVPEQPGEDG